MGLAPLHPNIPTSKASYSPNPRSLRLRQHSERDEIPERDIMDRLLTVHIQFNAYSGLARYLTASQQNEPNPKGGGKKIPKYSTIHSDNLSVYGGEMGRDGQSEGHNGLDCMTLLYDFLPMAVPLETRSCVPGQGNHGNDWCIAYSITRTLLIIDLLSWNPDGLPVPDYDLKNG